MMGDTAKERRVIIKKGEKWLQVDKADTTRDTDSRNLEKAVTSKHWTQYEPSAGGLD